MTEDAHIAAALRDRFDALLARHQQAMANREAATKEIQELNAEIADVRGGARAFGISLPDMPTIDVFDPLRSVVLQMLSVAPNGLKASAMRECIVRDRGPLHEKTIGMTLYRLKRDGKVTREKRIWRLA